MTRRTQQHARPGSIYLVVLVTVAVVTTMVLTGIVLRKSMNDRYRMDNESAVAHNAARSAAEAAMVLASESSSFIDNAKSGTILSKTSVGDATIAATALDEDTGLAVTDSTDTIAVTAFGYAGDSRSMIGFQLGAVNAYLELLQEKGGSSYWPLDEPNGSGDAFDAFGVIDGEYKSKSNVGKGTFPDGGTAFVANGGSTDYVEIMHDNSFQVSQGTIMIWAKFKDISGSGDQAIFSKEDSDTAYFDIALYVESSSIKLRINSYYGFLDRDYSVNIAAKNDQNWHHYVYSFGPDGTKIYVDGTRLVHDPSYVLGLSYNAYGFSETNNERWWLGARRYSGSPTHIMTGELARFSFIPKQVSDAEVVELMDGQINAKKFEVVDGTFERVVE